MPGCCESKAVTVDPGGQFNITVANIDKDTVLLFLSEPGLGRVVLKYLLHFKPNPETVAQPVPVLRGETPVNTPLYCITFRNNTYLFPDRQGSVLSYLCKDIIRKDPFLRTC